MARDKTYWQWLKTVATYIKWDLQNMRVGFWNMSFKGKFLSIYYVFKDTCHWLKEEFPQKKRELSLAELAVVQGRHRTKKLKEQHGTN